MCCSNTVVLYDKIQPTSPRDNNSVSTATYFGITSQIPRGTNIQCQKSPGCYFDGHGYSGRCKLCPAGYYCDGQIKEPRKCPYGSTSYPGSVSITECYIEEISVSSFDDNYKPGGPYYFNGYNTAQFFTVGNTTQFPTDIAGSVCK